MNTSKYNLEQEIKKQIEEREITPSRDLWSEVEWQKGNNNSSKSRINWVLIAACLILTFSLGTVLFFFKNNAAVQPQIVNDVKKEHKDQIVEKQDQEMLPLAIENDTKPAPKDISTQEKQENIVAIPIPDKNTVATKVILPERKLEAIRISDPKMLAKADSSKIQVKKKKYVDPSTLLFSVEHKDVIEKTKDGSNVATIELNRK